MEKGRKGQHGLSEKGDRGGWAAPWTCTPAGEGRKERGGPSEKEGRGRRVGSPLAVGGGAAGCRRGSGAGQFLPIRRGRGLF